MPSPHWTGPAEPSDDGDFLDLVDRLVAGLVTSSEVHVRVVRVDGWFGPKWLRFAGKTLGALGVHTREGADLVVPPFTPARVVWEHAFVRKAADFGVDDDARPLHRAQASAANLGRRLAEFSTHGLFVWFSGATAENARGSVLVALLQGGEHEASHVGFARRSNGWSSQVIGTSTRFPEILRGGSGE